MNPNLDLNSDADASTPFQLDVTNSIWGQERYPFRKSYLATLAVNYGAGLQVIDFGADPDLARTRIFEIPVEKGAVSARYATRVRPFEGEFQGNGSIPKKPTETRTSATWSMRAISPSMRKGPRYGEGVTMPVSAPVDPFEMTVDRPFVHLIRDREIGTVLFLGRVVDAGAAQPS